MKFSSEPLIHILPFFSHPFDLTRLQEEEDVEVDLDVLPPSTLWKLYRYVSR